MKIYCRVRTQHGCRQGHLSGVLRVEQQKSDPIVSCMGLVEGPARCDPSMTACCGSVAEYASCTELTDAGGVGRRSGVGFNIARWKALAA